RGAVETEVGPVPACDTPANIGGPRYGNIGSVLPKEVATDRGGTIERNISTNGYAATDIGSSVEVLGSAAASFYRDILSFPSSEIVLITGAVVNDRCVRVDEDTRPDRSGINYEVRQSRVVVDKFAIQIISNVARGLRPALECHVDDTIRTVP